MTRFALLLLASAALISPAHATVPALSPSCPASTAFVSRASANIAAALAANDQGTLTYENVIDTYICGQVAAGTWATKDVEYFSVAPTEALAEMNLVSGSYTLAPKADVTFTPNGGMTGAATANGYADTGYTPSSGQMTTSSSLVGVCVLNARTTLNATQYIAEVGTQNTTNYYGMDILSGSSASLASYFALQTNSSIVLSQTALPSTQGGFWASHTNPSTSSAFVNGVNVASGPATTTSLAGLGDFYVFGMDSSGSLSGGVGIADTIGAVVLGAGETDAQVIADNTLLTNALHSMGVSGCDGLPGPVVGLAPANTAIPEIVGEDFPPTGATAITLSAKTGEWDNTPTSFAYNWHTVNAPTVSLGASPTLTLDTSTSGILGQALEVDVTATNAGGSSKQSSHWFGLIESSAPVAPVAYETLGTVGPSSLPISPANFLQNGHAIYPGCDIPPVAPNLTPSNVFYFDPINGTTPAQQTAAGVATTSQGHAGHPFKDISTLFNGLFGHGKTIPPGSVVYIEPGDATHPIGSLSTGAAMYSTADGTATGTTVWTWIMGDPASARPVLNTIHNQNGSIGFLFKHLGVEPATVGSNGATIGSAGQGAAAPSHNMIYEDIKVSSWIGHSDDPWYPSAYPTTGGQSDGTVVTASPAIPQAGSQDPSVLTVTMAAGDTSFAAASAPSYLVGEYVWSQDYYRSRYDSIPYPPSGIPNGTKVVSVTSTTVQLGPCDPVADAATGCPSTPIPGCDPKVTINGVTTGGCPIGTPPAWSGATRALSAERLSFTPQMSILPAGYFNNADWGNGLSDAFNFGGGLDVANSKDPSNPNLLVGSDCISVKDSVVRDVRNAFGFFDTHNSIAYNNRVKWTSGDMFDVYSDNRVWIVHNYGSDPTQIWDHQDAIQFGDSNGRVATNYYYGSAAIENEFLQAADPTNWFPRSMQGINNTENNLWGAYVADNTVVATTGANGIQILGRYNVVVQNDMFGGRINVGHQAKGAALPSPIGSMLANNIGNGVTRDNTVATYCDPAAGDLDVLKTNLSIPFIPIGGGVNSQAYCTLSGAALTGAAPGQYQGLETWTQTDWQSQLTGISPIFEAYHPLDPPVAPAPGAGLFPQPIISPCVQGSIVPFITTCAPAAFGTLNLRPNPAFSGTTNPIIADVGSMYNGVGPAYLPQQGTIGDTYVLTAVSECFGGQASWCGPANSFWQSGLLVRVGNSTTDATLNWQHTVDPNNSLNFILPHYNPGIIGAGTNLGAQQPIADHDGKAWNSPPSIGAYESH